MTPNLAKIGAALFAAVLGLSLASCGRRGPLEPPPGVPVSSSPLNGTVGDSETPTRELLNQQSTGSATEAPEPAGAPKPTRRAAKTIPARSLALIVPCITSRSKNGVMHAEDVDLAKLAAAVGTPFYCYSTATLDPPLRGV